MVGKAGLVSRHSTLILHFGSIVNRPAICEIAKPGMASRPLWPTVTSPFCGTEGAPRFAGGFGTLNSQQYGLPGPTLKFLQAAKRQPPTGSSTPLSVTEEIWQFKGASVR